MGFADFDECFVLRLLVANEGTVGFDDDSVLFAVLDALGLLTPRMKLQCELA